VRVRVKVSYCNIAIVQPAARGDPKLRTNVVTHAHTPTRTPHTRRNSRSVPYDAQNRTAYKTERVRTGARVAGRARVPRCRWPLRRQVQRERIARTLFVCMPVSAWLAQASGCAGTQRINGTKNTQPNNPALPCTARTVGVLVRREPLRNERRNNARTYSTDGRTRATAPACSSFASATTKQVCAPPWRLARHAGRPRALIKARPWKKLGGEKNKKKLVRLSVNTRNSVGSMCTAWAWLPCLCCVRLAASSAPHTAPAGLLPRALQQATNLFDWVHGARARDCFVRGKLAL
jgi:hypothetical protein